MNDVLFAATCLVVATAAGVMIVPKQKPEPPVVCQLKDAKDCTIEPVGQAKPVIVARPQQNNAQTKVDKIAKDLADTRKDLAEIKEALKAKQGVNGESPAQ